MQPMTLEAERGGSTRGAMLDSPTQQDPRLRLEIGICGVTKADGTEVLEVRHLELTHAHAIEAEYSRSRCSVACVWEAGFGFKSCICLSHSFATADSAAAGRFAA